MIKARCFKCGHAFHLSEQFIANALANEGLTRKPSHYTAECPQCRQAIKLPLKRVRLPEAEPPGKEPGDEEPGDEQQRSE